MNASRNVEQINEEPVQLIEKGNNGLSTMNASRNVEHTNEAAVELLKKGNFVEAVSTLDRALGFLMVMDDEKSSSCSCGHSVTTKSTYVGNDDSSSSLDASFSEAGCLDDVTGPKVAIVIEKDDGKGFPATHKTIRSVPIRGNLKDDRESNDNIFEFYSGALVLPATSASCLESQRCVILYNMGVSYHNEAIRLREDPSVVDSCVFSYYQCALNLYNMAQFHLHQAWSKMEDEGTKLLLALALSNNSGHIHAQQLNFKETQYSLEAVKHFMDSIPEEATSEDIGLSRKDHAFFTRTSLIFEDNNLDIAPSA